MLVGASCTAELIQDDPGGLAKALGLPMPVVPLELPAYQRKENWGAAETFYQLVRTLAGPRAPPPGTERARATRRAAALQPPRPDRARLPPPRRRHRDHRPARAAGRRRSTSSAPLGATPGRHRAAGRGRLQRRALSRDRRPGRALAGADLRPALDQDRADRRRRDARLHRRGRRARRRRSRAGAGRSTSRLPWYSRSVDSTYLTGKRVFIFGDATHAIAAARVAARRAGLHGRRARQLQPRVRPRGPRGGRAATASSR